MDTLLSFLPTLLPDAWAHYLSAGLQVLGDLVAAASIITPFTSTPKDDAFLGKITALMHRFSVTKPQP